VPGLGSPLIQFVNGDAATLTMDLFLDDYTDAASPDVYTRITQIASLMNIDQELHAPSPVRFVWGKLRFKAVLEKVGRKITLFRPDGTPARATLSCTFREFRELGDPQLDDPRPESADKTKRRQISASDTIWLIANREYGDIREWRAIAHASDVDDPRALRPRTWLRAPPLERSDGLRSAR
jgi:nucleoid-associated protein YgaU